MVLRYKEHFYINVGVDIKEEVNFMKFYTRAFIACVLSWLNILDRKYKLLGLGNTPIKHLPSLRQVKPTN